MNYIVDELDYFAGLLITGKAGILHTNPEGFPYAMLENGDRLLFKTAELEVMSEANPETVTANVIRFTVDSEIKCVVHLIADEHEDTYVIVLQCNPFTKHDGSDVVFMTEGCITEDLENSTK